MSATYTLADVLNNILAAIQDTLYYISKAIADNANAIATALVVGALAFAMVRIGGRVWRGVSGFLRGLI